MSSLVKSIGLFIGGTILGVAIGASLPNDNGRFITIHNAYGAASGTLDTRTGQVYSLAGEPVEQK